jgi:hypothetical protein
VIEITIFIGCGDEVSHLRDVGLKVLDALERAFLNLGVPLVVRNWDWREQPPEIVPLGEFATRSLTTVERAYAFIGILGSTVPNVTGQEIHKAVAKFGPSGATDRVLIYADKNAEHDKLHELIAQIEDELGFTIVYQPFEKDLDLQRHLFTALLPIFLRRVLPPSALAVVAADEVA